MKKFILACFLCLCITGCNGIPRLAGGDITVKKIETETPIIVPLPPKPLPPTPSGNGILDIYNQYVYEDKLQKFLDLQNQPPTMRKTTETTVTVQQPENPQDGAKLETVIEPDNRVTVSGGTGKAQDVAGIAKVMANFKLSYVPMVIGVGMIVVGGLAIGLAKQVKTGSIFVGIGILLMILAYALAEYAPILILIGILSAIAWAIYLLWKNGMLWKAHVENTSLVQAIKKDMTPEDQEHYFTHDDSVANLIQSDSTKKVVAEVKKKENFDGR